MLELPRIAGFLRYSCRAVRAEVAAKKLLRKFYSNCVNGFTNILWGK